MSTLTLLFVLLSQANNLPEGLLSALCYVESNHRIEAFHRDDGLYNSVGVCQVQLGTARFMGFKGSEARLRDVDTNVAVAASYLLYQLTRYHGDVDKAISAYNMGTYRVNMFGVTSNKRYVDKVRKAWKEHR